MRVARPIVSDSAAGLTTVVRHASGLGAIELTQATQVDSPHAVSDSRRNGALGVHGSSRSSSVAPRARRSRAAGPKRSSLDPRGAWTGIAERGSLGGLRLIRWIYARFGRGPVMVLLTPIVAYFFVTGGAARRASHGLSAHALGDTSGSREPRRAADLASRLPTPLRVRREHRRQHDRVERRRRTHPDRRARQRASARARA